MGLGPKIYLVVILLALVAASISYVGIDAMRTYNRRVHQMQHYTHFTVVGEQINGLILSVVMDSRGVYMARDHVEAEKYAPLILKNLATMKQKMAEWTDFTEKEDMDKMDRANARADEFIKFRTELVRLSREATLDEARAFGDNEVNRNNRKALNQEMVTLAEVGEAHVRPSGGRCAAAARAVRRPKQRGQRKHRQRLAAHDADPEKLGRRPGNGRRRRGLDEFQHRVARQLAAFAGRLDQEVGVCEVT